MTRFVEGPFRKTLMTPVFSWESQARQYPNHGGAGITYFAGEIPESDLPPVDCLLYRTRFGQLIGILNHYPVDYPPYEQAGNFLVLVHPGYRHRGVATQLFDEAVKRWGITLEGQKYSQAGADWANAMHERARLKALHDEQVLDEPTYRADLS